MPETVLHGARVEIHVAGKKVGWGTDFQGTIQSRVLPVEVIGRPEPAALLKVGYIIDGRIGFVRLLEDDLKEILPPMDGEHPAEFVNFPPFQIAVYAANPHDDKPIFVIEDAVLVNYTMQVQARSFVMQNVAIQATRIRHRWEQ